MVLAGLWAFSKETFELGRDIHQVNQPRPANLAFSNTSRLFALEPLGFLVGFSLGGLVGFLVSAETIFHLAVIWLILSSVLILTSQSTGQRQKPVAKSGNLWPVYKQIFQQPRPVLGLALHYVQLNLVFAWLIYIALVFEGQTAYGLIGGTEALGAGVGLLTAWWFSRRPQKPAPVLSWLFLLGDLLGSVLRSFGVVVVSVIKPTLLYSPVAGWVNYEYRSIWLFQKLYNRSDLFKTKKTQYCLVSDTIAKFICLIIWLGLILISFWLGSPESLAVFIALVIPVSLGLTLLIVSDRQSDLTSTR